MNRRSAKLEQTIRERDADACVICGRRPTGLHFILDPALWPDETGLQPDNAVLLCPSCREKAEGTSIDCAAIRTACGKLRTLLPPRLTNQGGEIYDRYGNLCLTHDRRVPGELFLEERVQQALQYGECLDSFMRERIRHPRTYHLPDSPGLQKDDRRIDTLRFLEGQEVVITEKMDGENTSLERNACYARSPDSTSHPGRTWVRQLQGTIAQEIPPFWRICGENLYARHSIPYSNLPSYFMLFSVWDQRNFCLSWDATIEWAQLLGVHTVPVLYRGPWSEDILTQNARRVEAERDRVEGFVVRLASEFPYTHFGHCVAKYVRASHVQTGSDWRHKSVIPNRLANERNSDFGTEE